METLSNKGSDEDIQSNITELQDNSNDIESDTEESLPSSSSKIPIVSSPIPPYKKEKSNINLYTVQEKKIRAPSEKRIMFAKFEPKQTSDKDIHFEQKQPMPEYSSSTPVGIPKLYTISEIIRYRISGKGPVFPRLKTEIGKPFIEIYPGTLPKNKVAASSTNFISINKKLKIPQKSRSYNTNNSNTNTASAINGLRKQYSSITLTSTIFPKYNRASTTYTPDKRNLVQLESLPTNQTSDKDDTDVQKLSATIRRTNINTIELRKNLSKALVHDSVSVDDNKVETKLTKSFIKKERTINTMKVTSRDISASGKHIVQSTIIEVHDDIIESFINDLTALNTDNISDNDSNSSIHENIPDTQIKIDKDIPESLVTDELVSSHDNLSIADLKQLEDHTVLRNDTKTDNNKTQSFISHVNSDKTTNKDKSHANTCTHIQRSSTNIKARKSRSKSHGTRAKKRKSTKRRKSKINPLDDKIQSDNHVEPKNSRSSSIDSTDSTASTVKQSHENDNLRVNEGISESNIESAKITENSFVQNRPTSSAHVNSGRRSTDATGPKDRSASFMNDGNTTSITKTVDKPVITKELSTSIKEVHNNKSHSFHVDPLVTTNENILPTDGITENNSIDEAECTLTSDKQSHENDNLLVNKEMSENNNESDKKPRNSFVQYRVKSSTSRAFINSGELSTDIETQKYRSASFVNDRTTTDTIKTTDNIDAQKTTRAMSAATIETRKNRSHLFHMDPLVAMNSSVLPVDGKSASSLTGKAECTLTADQQLHENDNPIVNEEMSENSVEPSNSFTEHRVTSSSGRCSTDLTSRRGKSTSFMNNEITTDITKTTDNINKPIIASAFSTAPLEIHSSSSHSFHVDPVATRNETLLNNDEISQDNSMDNPGFELTTIKQSYENDDLRVNEEISESNIEPAKVTENSFVQNRATSSALANNEQRSTDVIGQKYRSTSFVNDRTTTDITKASDDTDEPKITRSFSATITERCKSRSHSFYADPVAATNDNVLNIDPISESNSINNTECEPTTVKQSHENNNLLVHEGASEDNIESDNMLDNSFVQHRITSSTSSGRRSSDVNDQKYRSASFANDRIATDTAETNDNIDKPIISRPFSAENIEARNNTSHSFHVDPLPATNDNVLHIDPISESDTADNPECELATGKQFHENDSLFVNEGTSEDNIEQAKVSSNSFAPHRVTSSTRRASVNSETFPTNIGSQKYRSASFVNDRIATDTTITNDNIDKPVITRPLSANDDNVLNIDPIAKSNSIGDLECELTTIKQAHENGNLHVNEGIPESNTEPSEKLSNAFVQHRVTSSAVINREQLSTDTTGRNYRDASFMSDGITSDTAETIDIDREPLIRKAFLGANIDACKNRRHSFQAHSLVDTTDNALGHQGHGLSVRRMSDTNVEADNKMHLSDTEMNNSKKNLSDSSLLVTSTFKVQGVENNPFVHGGAFEYSVESYKNQTNAFANNKMKADTNKEDVDDGSSENSFVEGNNNRRKSFMNDINTAMTRTTVENQGNGLINCAVPANDIGANGNRSTSIDNDLFATNTLKGSDNEHRSLLNDRTSEGNSGDGNDCKNSFVTSNTVFNSRQAAGEENNTSNDEEVFATNMKVQKNRKHSYENTALVASTDQAPHMRKNSPANDRVPEETIGRDNNMNNLFVNITVKTKATNAVNNEDNPLIHKIMPKTNIEVEDNSSLLFNNEAYTRNSKEAPHNESMTDAYDSSSIEFFSDGITDNSSEIAFDKDEPSINGRTSKTNIKANNNSHNLFVNNKITTNTAYGIKNESNPVLTSIVSGTNTKAVNNRRTLLVNNVLSINTIEAATNEYKPRSVDKPSIFEMQIVGTKANLSERNQNKGVISNKLKRPERKNLVPEAAEKNKHT